MSIFMKNLGAVCYNPNIGCDLLQNVCIKKLFKALETIVPILPISDLLNQIPIIGSKLKHIVPVANLSDEINLTKYKMREWSILDTFDWYSPTYDNPQSIRMLENLAKESKLRNAEITRPGHLVLSGQK